MKQQFKVIFLILVLISGAKRGTSQEITDSILQIQLDSISYEILNAVKNRSRIESAKFDREIQQQKQKIDSLITGLNYQEEFIQGLENENANLKLEVAQTKEKVESNQAIIQEKAQTFKRVLLITGPSIVLLLLILSLLYFILLVRQQDETDKKINALKKYTYSEIEETKEAILKRFKKRISRLKSVKKSGGKEYKHIEKRIKALEKAIRKSEKINKKKE